MWGGGQTETELGEVSLGREGSVLLNPVVAVIKAAPEML